MGQFGEALRSERLSRGIALETISEGTKVGMRYLSALEEEQFDALPGGILSKGVVRGYVRTLGMDEKVWVERFVSASRERGVGQSDDSWVEFAQNVGRTRARMHARRQLRLRWVGVAALLLLVAGLGFFVWRYVSGRALAGDLQQRPVTSAAITAPGQ